MNILWINKITDREYWRTTQVELSKSLRKRGNKVTLVMAKNAGENKPVEDDTIYLPILPHHLLSGLIFGLALFFCSPLMVRKEKIDVIMIDGTSVWLPFVVPLKLFKVPLVIDVRDLSIEKKTSMLFDFSLFLSKYIADGLTTITQELREVLREKYRLCNKKIGIWSSGVSLENFNGGCSSNSFHKGESSKYFTLLHHGSYGGDRGVENLILAIGKLDEHIRGRVKLLLVGIPLEHQKGFLRLCEKVGVKEQVSILPIVEYEKIPFYIQMADVGVIPLPPDKTWCRVSVPLKTLEYLAMGKPIIATSIPFHQRIFEKGRCGVLIHTNTPEALSDAVTYLYQNREKITAMGKIGREIVEKHYSWDNMAFKVEMFLKNILQGYQNEN
ncbi:MAG TPA: glycosyltransferase [Thermoplasmatales archaeon]|nr:glycosyltransferase [Thermoplasmatales archaeon]